MRNIVLEIQKQFFEKLEEKTGWGKNEIQSLYQSVSIEVLSDYASAMAELRRTPIKEPSQPLPDNNEPVSPRGDYSPTAAFSGFDDDDEPIYDPQTDDLPF